MSDHQGRPMHPDFDLLSKIVLGLDDNPDSSQDFADFIGSIVDPASITYMANGRAMMALHTLGEPPTLQWLAAFGAMYIDGFLLGIEFAKHKAASRLADRPWLVDLVEQLRDMQEGDE
jgi:hypothetical protein